MGVSGCSHGCENTWGGFTEHKCLSHILLTKNYNYFIMRSVIRGFKGPEIKKP